MRKSILLLAMVGASLAIWQIAVAGCGSTAGADVAITPNGCGPVYGGYIDDVNSITSYPGPCRISLNPFAGCQAYTYQWFTRVYISDNSNCSPETFYSSHAGSGDGGLNFTCTYF